MTPGYQKVGSANFSKLLAVKPMPEADMRFGPPARLLPEVAAPHRPADPSPSPVTIATLPCKFGTDWRYRDLALTWPVTATQAGQGTLARRLRHRGG